MTHALNLYPYCGMGPVRLSDGGRGDCRAVAARLLRRRRRQEFPVLTLEPGRAWEICTPDDAFGVSDLEGVLRLERVEDGFDVDDDEDLDG
jgi:hypothetical protein